MAIAISERRDSLPLLPPTQTAQALFISGFTGSTMITTDDGPVPVDWLRPGDRVLTYRGEYRPVTWVGRDCLRAPPDKILAAPLSRPGSEAGSETYLAARHRVAVTGWEVELYFGCDTMFVEAGLIARQTCAFPTARAGASTCSVLLTEHPEIISADGIWVETLQLNDNALGCMTDLALNTLSKLPLDLDAHGAPALPCLTRQEVEGLSLNLEKMVANGDPLPAVD